MVFDSLLYAGETVRATLDTIPDTTACTSCIAACCMKGNGIELTSDEATYLVGRGTGLRPLTKKEIPREIRRSTASGKVIYALETDCGNLDPITRQCTDYENRPGACRDFKADSEVGSPCHYKRGQIAERVNAGIVDLPMPVVPRFEQMVSC